MAASLSSYRRLGFDIPLEADAEGHVESIAGSMRIAWDTEEVVTSFDPDWRRAPGGHRIGLAFLCDSPADVDDRYADVTAAGYQSHKEPWDAFWGQRYAVAQDPDGNPIDLLPCWTSPPSRRSAAYGLSLESKKSRTCSSA